VIYDPFCSKGAGSPELRRTASLPRQFKIARAIAAPQANSTRKLTRLLGPRAGGLGFGQSGRRSMALKITRSHLVPWIPSHSLAKSLQLVSDRQQLLFQRGRGSLSQSARAGSILPELVNARIHRSVDADIMPRTGKVTVASAARRRIRAATG
jgi:hypothetical protein